MLSITFISLFSGLFLCLFWRILGFPGGTSGKEPMCQRWRHKRHGFDPWLGRILVWRILVCIPSILVWRTLWTEKPGRLEFTSLTVGHGWSECSIGQHTHAEECYLISMLNKICYLFSQVAKCLFQKREIVL